MKKVTMSTTNDLENLKGLRKIQFLCKKVFEYLVRYHRQPKYLFNYFTKSIQQNYREHVLFISDNKLIKQAKTRSTIRLQDGEMGLLLGERGIYFQSAEPRLIEKLSATIKNYSDLSPYLIGLPPFIPIPNNILDEQQFKFLWLPSKILYKLLFNKQAHYFNGCYFYIKNTVTPFLQETSSECNAIVVSNEENIALVQKQASYFFPSAINVHYIKTPKINAFSVYDLLYNEIKLLAKKSPKAIVYMACGPAGKALIYDLSVKENIIAHDIGHGIHFALTGENMEHMIKWSVLKDKYVEYSH